jgi:hypothetical protein
MCGHLRPAGHGVSCAALASDVPLSLTANNKPKQKMAKTKSTKKATKAPAKAAKKKVAKKKGR